MYLPGWDIEYQPIKYLCFWNTVWFNSHWSHHTEWKYNLLPNESDQFLEAKIPQYALWWLLPFHQRSSCSIAPCCSMPCALVLILTLCFQCLLRGDFITKALKNLHRIYFKHIWVVAVMEASQINSDAVNTLLTARVSCARVPLVKTLCMIIFPKIIFH